MPSMRSLRSTAGATRPCWRGNSRQWRPTVLPSCAARRRRDLLERRTEVRRGRRVIVIDGQRTLPLPPDGALRDQLADALRSLSHLYESPEYFLPRDFARRVAGMGSLGLPRYVALVRGRGDPDR